MAMLNNQRVDIKMRQVASSSKACSMLLGLLGRALKLSPDFALLLAALFLAHPIHTESAPRLPLMPLMRLMWGAAWLLDVDMIHKNMMWADLRAVIYGSQCGYLLLLQMSWYLLIFANVSFRFRWCKLMLDAIVGPWYEARAFSRNPARNPTTDRRKETDVLRCCTS